MLLLISPTSTHCHGVSYLLLPLPLGTLLLLPCPSCSLFSSAGASPPLLSAGASTSCSVVQLPLVHGYCCLLTLVTPLPLSRPLSFSSWLLLVAHHRLPLCRCLLLHCHLSWCQPPLTYAPLPVTDIKWCTKTIMCTLE